MKAEKIKTLAEYLEDEKVSGKICEVRNEQITGDKAVRNDHDQGIPNGIKIIYS